MKQNSHEIKLQNDLIINLADKPHLIAWGKSGSGKSSLLFSMILQLFMSGSEVYFIDPKKRIFSLSRVLSSGTYSRRYRSDFETAEIRLR